MSDASVVAMETNGSKDLFEMSVNCVSGPPQWDFMHGLMENAVYGGRVDNMFDMRVLWTYLRQCFDDKTIPGQAGAPRRGGRKWEGLPFGTIPVSMRIQVMMGVGRDCVLCVCVFVCVCVCVCMCVCVRMACFN